MFNLGSGFGVERKGRERPMAGSFRRLCGLVVTGTKIADVSREKKLGNTILNGQIRPDVEELLD